ncbi:S-adenosylhomocysteine deaminase [Sulfuriferula multivorans]|uniref:S-adenosylhomocysteine deaminase n=1 Tax=Sulfuriferula multivorans TaxID=1559896 RepID=A0A401JFJ0_9PROT|nr:amidohydrolase family protein [Sulfuriferula multivorans]GBL46392.1 S-adenosylhomocysteine deaminase [Sulfuriferula multivorans]
MPSKSIQVDWLLAHPGKQTEQRGAEILVDSGSIASVIALRPVGNGLIALPGLTNAHDHARAFRTSALGAFDKPLESWLFYLGIIPGVDAYRAAATSLGRSALHGVGRIMMHYTRPQGLTDPVSEARAVARAARDVGVHAGFAVAMRDRHSVTYADTASTLNQLPVEIRAAVKSRLDASPLPPHEQLALADEIAQACHGPGFNVQYGPTGVQWCSPELLSLIAETSARNGRQIHMHLLETRYQREWADRAFPDGIVAYLRDIGLLGPRLTLAHCTYCRPEELELIAASGATIVVNTSSNLGLRSGIAPVATMLEHGCKVAMGLDGLALDEDDDALRELRLLYHLHKGWGYETTVSAAHAWQIACRHGRYAVSGITDNGGIATGGLADLLILDGHALMDDRIFDDVEVFDFVLARASAQHISKVIVAGNTIVDNGRLTGIDYPSMMNELLAELRANIDPHDTWRRTVQELDLALKPFYLRGHHLGCC